MSGIVSCSLFRLISHQISNSSHILGRRRWEWRDKRTIQVKFNTILNNDFFNQNFRTCSIGGLGFPRFVHAKRKPHVSIFYIAWSDFLSVHKSFVPRAVNIFLETSSFPSLFALKVVRYLPLINRIRNSQICTRDCSINQFWALQRLSHALNPPVQTFRNSEINFL